MTNFKQVFNEYINQDEIIENVLHTKRNYMSKPVLAICCALIIIVSFFHSQSTDNELYINKLNESMLIHSDMDIKIINAQSLHSEFFKDNYPMINQLLQNECSEYEWDLYYVIVRENLNTNDYNILHDYVLNLTLNDKRIEIKFSEIGQPLNDCIIDINLRKSMMNEVKLTVSQINDSYYIKFENGLYFDIHTQNITYDELISILEVLTTNNGN